MLPSPHQFAINEFMRRAGQAVPEVPCVPEHAVLYLRASLIIEEALETLEALGCMVDVEIEQTEDGLKRHTVTVYNGLWAAGPDLVKIADGCADLSVVTIGTLSACGIIDTPILRAVDQSNLEKFGPGATKREDGKWLKPPTWRAPDLLSLLKEQGYEVPNT